MKTLALIVLCTLGLVTNGCAAIGGAFMLTGITISCGPMPMSPDSCEGGWVKSLFATASPGPSPNVLLSRARRGECRVLREDHEGRLWVACKGEAGWWRCSGSAPCWRIQEGDTE
jgi:hypothetical protein